MIYTGRRRNSNFLCYDCDENDAFAVSVFHLAFGVLKQLLVDHFQIVNDNSSRFKIEGMKFVMCMRCDVHEE